MKGGEAGAESARQPSVSVGDLLSGTQAELELELVAGAKGLTNEIEVARIQKVGLALTGFSAQVRAGRVQIFGSTEAEFCEGLDPGELSQALEAACRIPVTAFVVTKGLEPPGELLDVAEKHDVPLITSPQTSSVVIAAIQAFLGTALAPRLRIHGVLLDVFGLGVLLLGESGIGKSECGLDLIQRGHRLVSDDAVEISKGKTDLLGTGPDLLRHHVELRGIGIVNIKDLFGVSSIKGSKEVDLVIRLVRWEEGAEYERLGIDDRFYSILDTDVPYLELPVASGRNLAILVEVAARNQLLKRKGYHPARALVDLLDKAVLEGSKEPPTNDSPQDQEA